MSTCNTTDSATYRRKNGGSSIQETTSSVANLIDVTASCETLDNVPGSALSVNKKKTAKCSKSCSAFKGFMYTFLCSLFITISSVIVKKMTYIAPGQLSMIRNIGVFVGNIPIVVYSGDDPLGPKSQRAFLLLRSFLGATALYLNLLAYRLLPLAEAAIIMSTVPALVFVAARIFLKEPCGVFQTIALIITLTGVMLSIRLPEILATDGMKNAFSSDDILGISCAVGCVLLLSMTFVALRKIKDVHFSVIMVYVGLLGALENAVLTGFLTFFAWPRCGFDVLLVVVIAIFGFVGNSCLTLAIQSEAVGIVSVLKASLDIFLAMILQIIFFGNMPDEYNIYGAVLVLISVSMIGIRKWLEEKPEGSLARKRLKVFLF